VREVRSTSSPRKHGVRLRRRPADPPGLPRVAHAGIRPVGSEFDGGPAGGIPASDPRAVLSADLAQDLGYALARIHGISITHASRLGLGPQKWQCCVPSTASSCPGCCSLVVSERWAGLPTKYRWVSILAGQKLSPVTFWQYPALSGIKFEPDRVSGERRTHVRLAPHSRP
jgi:hypothetical protein